MDQPLSDEELLADLLLDWEDACHSQTPKSPEQLCGPRTDLVHELTRRIEILGCMDRMLGARLAETRSMSEDEFARILPPDLPSVPGFRVMDEIGRGGMGIVYKATQLNLERDVALKLINNLSQRPQVLIARLRNEADALARLNLENVIRVIDVIDLDGMPCLVLEYVDGKNLAQRDTKSSIDPKSAAEIALTVARTMSSVHDHGILHRDLKPANILMSKKGLIKISDFGLAKHLAGDTRASLTTEAIGSPSYMAPEQAVGASCEIGVWTDVYGIGATLYDLITGRPPFLGATHLATLEQVRNNDPVPPRLLVPEIPRDLDTICLKCLAKDPRNRYPCAAALASDLENFLAGRPISARPLGPFGQAWRWSKRNPDRAGLIAAIALSLLLAVGVGAWEITRIHDAALEKQKSEKELDAALKQTRTKEFYLALAEISDRSLQTPREWSWINLDQLKLAARIAPPDDQAAIYRLRSEATRALAALDARKQRELLHGYDSYTIEFTPDGSLLAAGENTDLNGNVRIALVETSTWELTHTLEFPANEQWMRLRPDGVRSLLFSPDGTKLFVGSRSGEICVFDMATRQHIRRWKAHSNYLHRIRFSSDGHALITCSKDKSVKKWSLDGQLLASIEKESEFTDLVVVSDRFYAQTPMIAVAGMSPLWLRESDFQTFEPDRDQLDWIVQNYEVAVAYPDGGGWVRDSIETYEIADSHRHSSLRRIIDRRAKFRDASLMHGIGMSSDGQWLVTSNADATKLWDLIAGERVALISTGGRGRIVGRFHPSKNLLALCGDSRLKIYELSTHDVWTARLQQPHKLHRVAISHSGETIAATRSSRFFRKDSGDFEELNQVLTGCLEHAEISLLTTIETGQATEIQCVPGEHSICFNHQETTSLRFFPLDESAKHRVIESPEIIEAEIIRFSPDGKRLYFVSESVTSNPSHADRDADSIKVLDRATSEIKTLWINSVSQEKLRVSSIESFAVGSTILTCTSLDGSIRILDPSTGAVRHKIDLSGIADSISLSPDERTIVAGTRDGNLLVINSQTGRIEKRVPAHRDSVSAVTFAGGNLIVSGSRDADLKLWQLQNEGSLIGLLTLSPLSDQVKSLAATADGRAVAVLIEDETAVRILRVDLLKQRLAEFGLDW
ncbi:protein kinase domain-containing protein [Schlesneria sp.]|uniref:protein kinase domain-containing protein n=1 Tax=Schlesneria sp. TaxID=2762018 RepID=UPI002EE801C3